ncbi:hypothetical protein [Robiginitalea sp. SC105]|uniref:hypothetical protein n=1 Tax=Robiginitalea sp. SC105 TaxID=2762332 RepID=UPI001639B168|nr:hypothetical protein [Robiginitalea sp. SC105]MBC2838830.1 hypothetical protein [Robiginitalea sp. SC105]
MGRFSLRGLILGLLLLASGSLAAQEEFFHELELETVVWENERWEVAARTSWKHIYDEVAWRKFGLDGGVIRKAGNWGFLGGLSTFYTFNKEIDNFWEVRPWVAIQYTFPLFRTINVKQRLRSEWRNFFQEGGGETINYHRLRYAIWFGFRLWESERWSQQLGFENYFVDLPAILERFPNERDYRLLFLHELPNSNELFFGVKVETFFIVDTREKSSALLLILGYRI